jgi:hypothetical protein
MRPLLIITLLMAFIASSTIGAEKKSIAASENSYDFGHIGIDYKVFHMFKLYNQGSTPVIVKSINVLCQCTSVEVYDTALAPGESTDVRISLDTYTLFGKTTKNFTLQTNSPITPNIDFTYSSTVGQWPFGLKPDPASLLFLPGNKPKTITLTNPILDDVQISLEEQVDTVFDVSITKDRIPRNGKTEIVVAPKSNLIAGTYLSSFLLKLVASNAKDPIILNIPIKIVRY